MRGRRSGSGPSRTRPRPPRTAGQARRPSGATGRSPARPRAAPVPRRRRRRLPRPWPAYRGSRTVCPRPGQQPSDRVRAPSRAPVAVVRDFRAGHQLVKAVSQTSAQVAVMDLPPSAAPRRRAPPQGRLCGRSPASSERRRVASLVAVPAGAPVSVARPRPRPKGTTGRYKPMCYPNRLGSGSNPRRPSFGPDNLTEGGGRKGPLTTANTLRIRNG